MTRPRTSCGALARSTSGAMALTVSQLFLGAISLGIGMFRGTEVYTAFHHEALVGHANYGSSKIAAEHGRAANVVVNDNVVMTAMMGPRFAVEADNITMDANAAIACRTCPHGKLCEICKQYRSGKPRALVKLAWIRAKQAAVWGSLGKLSGDVDRLASMQASSLVTADLAHVDPRVSIRFEDPGRDQDIWGGSNAATSCSLAAKDTLASPMLGHAFPLLISPNLLEGLPRVLVQAFPQVLCVATDAANEPTAKLTEIRSVAEKTRDDCRDLEDQMQCAIAAARGQPGACRSYSAEAITDLHDQPAAKTSKVAFSSDVQPFVSCQRATPTTPLENKGGGYVHRDPSGDLITCSFDRDKCQDKRLRENSDTYLRKELGLPKIVGNVASFLGGSETRMPRLGGWNSSPDFCACSFTARPIDETVIGISDAVRRIASFGAAGPSEALRKRREYRSCGRWYFPDGKGEFASVTPDQQPFVAAWKWSLVDGCAGGDGR